MGIELNTIAEVPLLASFSIDRIQSARRNRAIDMHAKQYYDKTHGRQVQTWVGEGMVHGLRYI